ncbi:MAG: CehA/McbA family metallohydrolase [Saprospiraceae bacterium]|nr:CehA/McbA family metallohydrolase [Saprospiraceae bacterium]
MILNQKNIIGGKIKLIVVILLSCYLFTLTTFLFGQQKWYRGNTHAHTTNSDGALSPAAIVEEYKQRGYDFIFITDHNIITSCVGLSSPDFLCCPGEEVTFKRHINGLNLTSLVSPTNTAAVIKDINDQGGLAILDHPYYPNTIVYTNEILELSELSFIEIHNASGEARGFYLNDQVLWDSILTNNKMIYGIAADDSHIIEDIGKAWIKVNAGALKKDSIVSAIKRGKFYSTTGVIINNLQIIDSAIYLSSVNGNNIEFIGEYGRILKTENKNSANYKISGQEGYIRIACSNQMGQKAWTQPIVWNNQFESDVIIISDDSYINDVNFNNYKFAVYPNPTTGIIHLLSNELYESYMYTIINTVGQIIKQGEIIDNQISILDISLFQKGVYFIHLSNKEFTESHKIILH